MADKEAHTVAGSADFKTAPDEKGEVEIGYRLGLEFERRGGGYNLFPARFLSDFFGPQGAANSRASGAVLVPSQVDDIFVVQYKKKGALTGGDG